MATTDNDSNKKSLLLHHITKLGASFHWGPSSDNREEAQLTFEGIHLASNIGRKHFSRVLPSFFYMRVIGPLVDKNKTLAFQIYLSKLKTGGQNTKF